MPAMNLVNDCQVSRPLNSVVAGTSNQNGTVLDMLGFDSVTFIASFGTLTAGQVTGLKAQSGALANGSDMADITSAATAAMADGDSTKLLLLDVIRPQNRYVRCVVTRGTANAVIDGVVAVQYFSKKAPETQGTTVSAAKTQQVT